MGLFFFGFVILPYLVMAAGLILLLRWFAVRKAGPLILEAVALAPAVIAVVWSTIDMLHAIHTSRSSTAAIGYLVMPWAAASLGAVWYGIAWSVMALVRSGVRWSRPEGRTRRAITEAAVAGVFLAAIAGGWYYIQSRIAGLAEAKDATVSDARLAELLDCALKREDVEMLAALADNPRAPETSLRRIFDLAQDRGATWSGEGYVVFRDLARNPRTPSDILSGLAGRRESTVRYMVAANPGTPEAVLDALSHDNDYLVRTSVCQNKLVTREILARLKTDKERVVREYAESAWGWRGFSADNGQ